MVTYSDSTAYIEIPEGINLEATFECGQAFRWRALPQGGYEGTAGSHRATIRRTDDGVSITPCDEALFEGFWRHYLDLDSDYGVFACELMRDEALSQVVAKCRGMRILNQPVWECLISFILSSNNNVARISGIVEKLCDKFGDNMGLWHAFPSAMQLAQAGESGIRACGAGYRAPFIERAAQAVAGGFDLEGLCHMGYDDAKKELMALHGVGEKVADCVLLFSCGCREAFPVDVWIGRAVPSYYPGAGRTQRELRDFAAKHFGKLAGLAQQYIFHYERNKGKQSFL
jgi:N-glycosylase/DNA lyase